MVLGAVGVLATRTAKGARITGATGTKSARLYFALAFITGTTNKPAVDVNSKVYPSGAARTTY